MAPLSARRARPPEIDVAEIRAQVENFIAKSKRPALIEPGESLLNSWNRSSMRLKTIQAI